MKAILETIILGKPVKIGGHEMFSYGDGTMTVRLASSLMGPTVSETMTGLRKLLKWLDKNAPA